MLLHKVKWDWPEPSEPRLFAHFSAALHTGYDFVFFFPSKSVCFNNLFMPAAAARINAL